MIHLLTDLDIQSRCRNKQYSPRVPSSGLDRLQWNSIAKGPGASPDFLFVLLTFYLWKAKGFPLGIKQGKQPKVAIVFH